MMGQDFENPLGIKTPKGKLKQMSAVLDSSVFPGTQGGPLEHVIAAKAVAFQEALSTDFADYVQCVKQNAHHLAQAFMARGDQVVSGGTDNHIGLLDLRNKQLTGKQAEEALGQADITLNENMVPFDTASPMVTSGIRLGTPAVTTRGVKGPAAMERIAALIDTVLSHINHPAKIAAVRQEVNAWMQSLPLGPRV